jgi:hypothetical protein
MPKENSEGIETSRTRFYANVRPEWSLAHKKKEPRVRMPAASLMMDLLSVVANSVNEDLMDCHWCRFQLPIEPYYKELQ